MTATNNLQTQELKLWGFSKDADSLLPRRLLSPHPSCLCHKHTHTAILTHIHPYPLPRHVLMHEPLARGPPMAAETSMTLSLFPHTLSHDLALCEFLMQGIFLTAMCEVSWISIWQICTSKVELWYVVPLFGYYYAKKLELGAQSSATLVMKSYLTFNKGHSHPIRYQCNAST